MEGGVNSSWCEGFYLVSALNGGCYGTNWGRETRTVLGDHPEGTWRTASVSRISSLFSSLFASLPVSNHEQ